MKIILALTMLFLNLTTHAADTPLLRVENSYDFALDIDYLKQGNIQYFSETYDVHDFKKLPEKIRSLDINNFRHEEKNHFVMYKYAFTIPMNNEEIFAKKLYTNSDYLMANNIGLISIEFPDENNLFKQTLTLQGRKIGFVQTDKTVFTVLYTELYSDTLESRIFSAIKNVEEKKLPEPKTMFCRTLNSEQKIFVGGITIASYYLLENNMSLVIFYKLAAIKPSFLIRTALKVGLSKVFFDVEREDAKNTVQKTRAYLEKITKT